MPRVKKPMKDVIGCEKPLSGANIRDEQGMSEWGNLLFNECQCGGKLGK